MSAYKVRKKTNGVFFVEFYEGTLRRRISTHTTDAKLARERARQITSGTFTVPNGPIEGTGGGMTLAELMDECTKTVWSPRLVRSQRTVKSNIKILSGIVGHLPVRTLTYADMLKLAQALFDRGYAGGTVHRKLCTLGKALTEATRMTDKDGKPVLAAKVPMPTVATRNSRSRVISPEEEAAIFHAIQQRAELEPHQHWPEFGHLMRFLLDTGARLGEAVRVEAAHLQDRSGVTFVTFPRYTTKNEKPRTLPLTQAVCAALPALKANAVRGRLFPFSTSKAWYRWNTIRDDVCAAGHPVQDVVLHTFRHTCLTRLATTGKVRLEQISEWAGHSSLQVTRDHYVHLMPETNLSTLAALEELATAIRQVDPGISAIAA